MAVIENCRSPQAGFSEIVGRLERKLDPARSGLATVFGQDHDRLAVLVAATAVWFIFAVAILADRTDPRMDALVSAAVSEQG